jgi:hypothetical protein
MLLSAKSTPIVPVARTHTDPCQASGVQKIASSLDGTREAREREGRRTLVVVRELVVAVTLDDRRLARA